LLVLLFTIEPDHMMVGPGCIGSCLVDGSCETEKNKKQDMEKHGLDNKSSL